MMTTISRLERIEVGAICDTRLETGKEQAFQYFGYVIEVRNRAVIRRIVRAETWLLEEGSDMGLFEGGWERAF